MYRHTLTAPDVMRIVSRLISKGRPFLSMDSSQKLRQIEQILDQEEALYTIVDGSQLETLLNCFRSGFSKHEERLDSIRHLCLRRSLLSLTARKRLFMSALNAACLEVKSQTSCTTSPPHMSKMEIKCLKSMDNFINEAYQILTLRNLPSLCNDKRMQTMFRTTAVPKLKVFGRNEDCEKIIDLLHDESEVRDHGEPTTNSDDSCFTVTGIHGIRGSGKSTLAQLVYGRLEKESYFDLLMWIHVPRGFSAYDVLSEMMEAATGKPCPQFRNLNILQEKVQDEVSAKRFFLVLDNVWYSAMHKNTIDARYTKLRQILAPLRAGKSGSKILATSRTPDALLVLGATGSRCIPIPELDDDAFLELFMYHAVGEVADLDERDRRRFETIGADIAKNLGKSPQAAVTVGIQLRARRNIGFWQMTRNRVLARARPYCE